KEIYVTDRFLRDLWEIYGEFTPNDSEYPTMGITIAGAPIFVACERYPDRAVVRRPATDEVRREDPLVMDRWREILDRYEGKCRLSTVHIHPMNHPRLSWRDIQNFDGLRQHPDDPSTFPPDHPYPVLLVNLNRHQLELLGFWVFEGRAWEAEVERISEEDWRVKEAWRRAKPISYGSREEEVVQAMAQRLGPAWRVELAVNRKTGGRAIRAKHREGDRVILPYDPRRPLGLGEAILWSGGGEKKTQHFLLEEYVDWQRLFDDLLGRTPAEVTMGEWSVSSSHLQGQPVPQPFYGGEEFEEISGTFPVTDKPAGSSPAAEEGMIPPAEEVHPTEAARGEIHGAEGGPPAPPVDEHAAQAPHAGKEEGEAPRREEAGPQEEVRCPPTGRPRPGEAEEAETFTTSMASGREDRPLSRCEAEAAEAREQGRADGRDHDGGDGMTRKDAGPLERGESESERVPPDGRFASHQAEPGERSESEANAGSPKQPSSPGKSDEQGTHDNRVAGNAPGPSNLM
ncbi:MAG: hypothetical protein D6795_17835, partial [Deltaproteobacteria bacterium]